MLGPKNFVKVFDGNYADRKRPANPAARVGASPSDAAELPWCYTRDDWQVHHDDPDWALYIAAHERTHGLSLDRGGRQWPTFAVWQATR